MVKMFRLVLGITLFCLFLPLAGPPDVSATFPIDLGGGLFLDTNGAVGTCNPCDLGTVQFIVTGVNGKTAQEFIDAGKTPDNRLGKPYAKVAVSVEAIDPGDFQQNVVEFEYRYQIIDPQFAINAFFLVPLIPPPDPSNTASKDPFGNFKILDFGSITDGDPSTVAPFTTTYSGPGIYLATFSGGIPQAPGEGPITVAKAGSDVLYIRSSLSPADLAATIDGVDLLAVVFGLAELKGPGSDLVAAAIAPNQTNATIFSDKATFLIATGATPTAPLPNLGEVDPSGLTVGDLTFSTPSTRLFVGTNGLAGQFPACCSTIDPDPWTTRIAGNAIAITGNEDLNIDLAQPVFSFGFEFVEPQFDPNVGGFIDSTFEVTLLNGTTVLESFTFNAPTDIAAFVGVSSTKAFDRVEIREIAGGAGNEFYGQFYLGGRITFQFQGQMITNDVDFNTGDLFLGLSPLNRQPLACLFH